MKRGPKSTIWFRCRRAGISIFRQRTFYVLVRRDSSELFNVCSNNFFYIYISLSLFSFKLTNNFFSYLKINSSLFHPTHNQGDVTYYRHQISPCAAGRSSSLQDLIRHIEMIRVPTVHYIDPEGLTHVRVVGVPDNHGRGGQHITAQSEALN